MLQTAGVSALGLAGLSTTAAAATRPEFVYLQRGVSFEPDFGSDEPAEAVRVDTRLSDGLVQPFAAIRYPETASTEVVFDGFDSTPDSVDVALFDIQRGSVTSTSSQTVNFGARFRYDSTDAIDDFFVDLVGDTLVE